MYEQAEPVRTPQAGSGRECNVKPQAPYQDPLVRRGNASGRGKHASQENKEKQGMSNVYEEAEAVKLKNISGDGPHGTDTSTDTDTKHEAKGRRICYIATALAVLGTLVVVGIVVLMFINKAHGQEKPFAVANVLGQLVL
ncbi:hypothetical protein Bbelb_240730 [Branchiostoma belcheri]|nr:hypothetical protein Bbelb_240730 [Branchiostoma belcheri]